MITRESDLPACVREVYHAAYAADRLATVAGGCLRDLWFGVPFNDIDIYVGPDFEPSKMVGWTVTQTADSLRVSQYSDFYGERLLTVFSACPFVEDDGSLEYLIGQEHPVQIIQLKAAPLDIQDVLNDFDMGFCQIGFRRGYVSWTRDFAIDAQRNTATSMFPKYHPRLEHSRLRAARLAARYPTRTFLFPL